MVLQIADCAVQFPFEITYFLGELDEAPEGPEAFTFRYLLIYRAEAY